MYCSYIISGLPEKCRTNVLKGLLIFKDNLLDFIFVITSCYQNYKATGHAGTQQQRQ